MATISSRPCATITLLVESKLASPANRLSRRGPGYHWTHDHFVRFDPAQPDRATGLVLSHAETCPGNEVSLSGMRYNDDYRRVDGRWVFQKRVISFLYYVPAKDYAQALNGPMRFTMGGNRLAGDYPESLPAWQAFDRDHGRIV